MIKPPAVAIIIKAKNSEPYFSSEKTKRAEIKIMTTSNKSIMHFIKEIIALEFSISLKEVSGIPKFFTAKDSARPQTAREKKCAKKIKRWFFLLKKTSSIKRDKAPKNKINSGINKENFMFKNI
jgi:hypothetical protein